MAQTSLLNGLNYAKTVVNQDMRDVRVAVRRAVHGFEAVPLEQLEEQLFELSSSLDSQINQEATLRSTQDANLTTLINNNYQTLLNLYQGQRYHKTVAARVTNLSDLNALVAGVDYNAATDDYHRLVLVDEGLDSSNNGIYYQTPTSVAGVYTYSRSEDWDAVADYQAGLEIFVDSSNQIYKVFDDAVVTEEGFAITLSPWQRPEFLQIDGNNDSQFLTKAGNILRAEIDDTYFRVLEGELTWSAALVTWKTSVDNALAAVSALQTTVASHTTQIATLESTTSAHTSSITGLNSQVSQAQAQILVLQNTDAQHDLDISALQTGLNAATAKNAEQDTRLNGVEQANTTQDGLITGLRTDVDAASAKNVQQDVRLTSLESSDTTQNNRLSDLESTATSHGNRIGTVENSAVSLRTDVNNAIAKNVEQDGRLSALESSDNSQSSLISGLRTDINTASAKNSEQDGRLTGLEASDATQTGLITGLRTDVDAASAKNAQQDTRLNNLQASDTAQGNRLTALEANDADQDDLIDELRTDVDGAIFINTQQDNRLDTLEYTATALLTEVGTKTTIDAVNTRLFEVFRNASIRRVLNNGVTSVIDGIYETVFNIDVSAEIAIMGAGAAYRVVTLNEAAVPYTQSGDLIANYPDDNTVTVTIHSISGAVANGEIEVSLHAFFLGSPSDTIPTE